jgi:hypothetical protein
MSVEKLVSQMAQFCDADNAKRWDRQNYRTFKEEFSDKNSVFAMTDIDLVNPGNRLETALAFKCKDQDLKDFVADLLLLTELRHYENFHKIDRWHDMADGLRDSLNSREANPKYKNILATHTVAQANSGVWA